jgi:hypothetical protein
MDSTVVIHSVTATAGCWIKGILVDVSARKPGEVTKIKKKLQHSSLTDHMRSRCRCLC